MTTIGLLVLGLFSLGLQLNPAICLAENLVTITRIADQQTVKLTVGKSVVLKFSQPVKEGKLGNPDLAETVKISPDQMAVTAKVIGTTTLIIWGWDGKPFAIRGLEVEVDSDSLQSDLLKIFPSETSMMVTAFHDYIVLSGTVANSDVKAQMEAIAKIYAPEKVLSHLSLR